MSMIEAKGDEPILTTAVNGARERWDSAARSAPRRAYAHLPRVVLSGPYPVYCLCLTLPLFRRSLGQRLQL